MPKKFSRCREDFVCEKCGTAVTGSGYTDHCPQCLWSKHVDVNPGDRASGCGGAMEPVGLGQRRSGFLIYYRCRKCHHEHRVKAAAGDAPEAFVALSRRLVRKTGDLKK